MKICMLTRHHSFMDARIFEKEAKSLAALEHDVTIVVHKKGGHLISINREPVRRPYGSLQKFSYQGIRFVTFDAVNPRTSTEKQNKMLNDLRKGAALYFNDPLAERALQQDADVYHAHEWDSLYDAVQVKRMARLGGNPNVKVIFDAHELEPDCQAKRGTQRYTLISNIMTELMKEVDHIITVSDGLKSIYSKRYPDVPITIVYNSPRFEPDIPRKNFAARPMIAAFEGFVTINKGNPLKILRITRLCRKNMKFRFKIIGCIPKTQPGRREWSKKLKSAPNIRMKWVEYRDIPKHMQSVHVGYIYLRLNNLNRKYSLANKFFSCLNCGVPVVANAGSDMKRIIERHACGIVINKKNPTAQDYANVFKRLYQNPKLLERMSINAREAMQLVYSWENMEQRLKDIYDHIQTIETTLE